MTDAPPTTLLVNGRRMHLDAEATTPLVFVLRNDLGLKGVRCGCGVGVCGACTVLADGVPIRSCSTPLEAVAGASITTPEGLGTPGRPHRVQQCFLDEGAAQCGYCINGIIMSTAAAVARGEPAVEQTPAWLIEHLCRCGTHPRVLAAVRRALGGTTYARPLATGDGAADEFAATPGAAEPPVDKFAPAPASGEVDPGRIESWIVLLDDGRVGIRTGRVELGQGIRSAMAQIVAAQVGVPTERVVCLPTTTVASPNEGYTAGSNSIDHGGVAIGAAAAGFARLLRERVSAMLGTTPDAVRIQFDYLTDGAGGRVTFAALAAAGGVQGAVEPSDRPDWSAAGLDRALPRYDLRHKLTGAPAYVHDLALPGMLHARALLPPNRDAVLEHLDISAVERMPGVVRIVVDGRIIVVAAEREEQAQRGIAGLERDSQWHVEDTGVDERALADFLRASETQRYVASQVVGGASATPTHRASYSTPYQAHAAIAPSCAVAHDDGEVLRVFTHSQGIYPLRGALAELLGLDADRVVLTHQEGPGCYGHNLADDAAAFAALAARALPGRPVRFQFSMEDEFTWEPLGPAMLADLSAVVDGDRRIGYWSHRAITDAHSNRPRGRAVMLLPAWLRTGGTTPDWPGASESGARNAVPIYDLPAVDAHADHVRGPLRTGSLRTLGAYLNTFAAESFMDEVAEQAGADPMAFRLAHLSDERARRVLEAAAAHVGWQPHVGPSGRGLGLALARYKHEKAFVAAAVEATVDPETAVVAVRRVVLACDAGAVVNPDGVAAQLEGGALQGLSRALHEQVRFDARGVCSRDWLSYPVIGFAEIPTVSVVLVDAREHPPLGVGEASPGPVAAALANAIDDATGIRLRDLPFTPERVRDRLFAMSEQEADRVLLD